MTLKKNDFIKIEFTASIKDTGEIFDSNIKEDIEKVSSPEKVQAKPFILTLGQNMFLKGVEDFLIGKPENTAEHIIELSPENAFGKRDPKKIQKVSTKIFQQQKVNPYPGAMFNFDGGLGKILTVSGGRTLVDFNNPIAGKDVIYKVKILEKINDLNQKANALIDFFFRQELKFEIKDIDNSPNTKKLNEKSSNESFQKKSDFLKENIPKKIIIEADSKIKNFIEMFKDKFKEILDLDLEVKETEDKEIKKTEKGKEPGKTSQ